MPHAEHDQCYDYDYDYDYYSRVHPKRILLPWLGRRSPSVIWRSFCTSDVVWTLGLSERVTTSESKDHYISVSQFGCFPITSGSTQRFQKVAPNFSNVNHYSSSSPCCPIFTNTSTQQQKNWNHNRTGQYYLWTNDPIVFCEILICFPRMRWIHLIQVQKTCHFLDIGSYLVHRPDTELFSSGQPFALRSSYSVICAISTSRISPFDVCLRWRKKWKRDKLIT